MKYKVGDWVVFKEPLMGIESNDGFILKQVFGKDTVRRIISTDEKNYGVDNYGGQTVKVEHKDLEGVTNIFNRAPSITKRINDKHSILNGLLYSDGSGDGEKLIKKLEENQVFIMNDRPQRPTKPASTTDDKAKGSHYERASMQPLEVMQRVMTKEQFKGFLFGNYIKYRLRSEFKNQRDSDEYKARQNAYWLEMVKDGHMINPSKDKVPFDYKFSII